MLEDDDATSIITGIFDIRTKLDVIAHDVGAIRAFWTTTMKKKRKKTTEELLGREYVESHERANRIMLERLAYHERRRQAEQASKGETPSA